MGSVNTLVLRIAARRAALAGEQGASMAEYGLLLALIAVVAIGALTSVGSGVKDKFTSVASNLG